MEMYLLASQADKNRRMVEQELADTNERLSDLTCQNQAIQVEGHDKVPLIKLLTPGCKDEV